MYVDKVCTYVVFCFCVDITCINVVHITVYGGRFEVVSHPLYYQYPAELVGKSTIK